jgi:hypothetical protein
MHCGAFTLPLEARRVRLRLELDGGAHQGTAFWLEPAPKRRRRAHAIKPVRSVPVLRAPTPTRPRPRPPPRRRPPGHRRQARPRPARGPLGACCARPPAVTPPRAFGLGSAAVEFFLRARIEKAGCPQEHPEDCATPGRERGVVSQAALPRPRQTGAGANAWHHRAWCRLVLSLPGPEALWKWLSR